MADIDVTFDTRPLDWRTAVSFAGIAAVGLLAVLLPVFASEYWLVAIIIPFLILSLAGLGLNLLTGYAGQISLGSGAFMMIGAYATFALQLRLPAVPLPLALVATGLIAAAVGVVFGFPATRIKSFYLIVSTLAAQFLFEWLFVKFPWFYNGYSAGSISLPDGIELFGLDASSLEGRYYLTLATVAILTLIASNLVRSQTGRNWMAIRDMDTAAAVIGVPIVRAKLQAFAVSSFILAIAGALWAFVYLGSAGVHSFGLTRSYQILFIIIIGGLGTIRGAFLGAAFVSVLPLSLDWLSQRLFGGNVDASLLQNSQKVIFGVLIVWFLIREPEGLARLLSSATAPAASLHPRKIQRSSSC